MTVDVSGHELSQTYDCRESGCTEPARHNRGPYAYLCDEHKERRRQRAATNPPAKPTSQPLESFEQKAKGLVALGRKVDRAYADASRSRTRCEPVLRKAQEAKRHADALAEEFRRTARELV